MITNIDHPGDADDAYVQSFGSGGSARIRLIIAAGSENHRFVLDRELALRLSRDLTEVLAGLGQSD
jgi:hypothetical protein